jgi:hypothetical protein
LRLYWNMLRRDRPDKTFIFVFHEDSSESQKSSFSSLFLEMLSKFEGSICLISKQPTTKLQHFFANEPRLVQSIVTWIESRLKVQS